MSNSRTSRRTARMPFWLAAVLAIALLPFGPTRATAQDQDLQNSDALEELTSGPIHEAYADVVALEPKPSPVIDRQPPEPINELPPEQQPAGERVEWLPGYWMWDVERNDFLWISGVYRNVPPNRRWVPGTWVEADGGWQRVAGFWADVEETSVTYLPAPPESLETGPTSPAPSQNHFWVPGCWYYQQSDYAWRPGYWSTGYSNWVWNPHRYVWSPRGYIWTTGYWDFLPARRGLLFAPVYFHRPIYAQANFYYRPRIVWNVASFIASWFVRPLDSHYYYGNYYGGSYANYGFLPWYSFYRTRGFYDPLYTWHRWDYRQRPWGRWNDWDDYVRDRHHYYRDNERARPPVTFAELNERRRDGRGDGFDRDDFGRDGFNRGGQSRDGRPRDGDVQLATRLEDFAARGGNSAIQLERVSDEMRNQMQERNQRWRELQQQRSTSEGLARGRGPDGERGQRGTERATLNLPEVFTPGERAARSATRDLGAERQQALNRGDVQRGRDLNNRFGQPSDFNQRGRTRSGEQGPRRVETLRPENFNGRGPTFDRPGSGDRTQQPNVQPNVQRPTPESRDSWQRRMIEQRLNQQRSQNPATRGPSPNFNRSDRGSRGQPNLQQSLPNVQRSVPNLQRSVPNNRSGGSLRAPQIEQRMAPQRQYPAFRGGSNQRGGSSFNRSTPSIQRSAPSVQRSAPSVQRSNPSLQRSLPSIQRGPSPQSRSGSISPRSGTRPSFNRGGGGGGDRGGRGRGRP